MGKDGYSTKDVFTERVKAVATMIADLLFFSAWAYITHLGNKHILPLIADLPGPTDFIVRTIEILSAASVIVTATAFLIVDISGIIRGSARSIIKQWRK